jgi:glycosyltransferase involved in cell wall biosynthesis
MIRRKAGISVGSTSTSTGVDRRRRIAHIIPWPSVGGSELAQMRLARAVEGNEFTSIAFCLPNAAPVREMFEREGIPVREYEATEPSYHHPREYVRTSLALARQLRIERVDLVHFADVFAAHRGTLAAVLARVPAITHVRNSFPETPSRRDASFLLPIRRFVFVSVDAMHTFGHTVSAQRSTVLYDGISPVTPDPDGARSVRAEFSIAPDAPVIGMIARVAPQKDYPTLIRAAAILKRTHSSVCFLIVGQHSVVSTYAEHYRDMRRLIGELGLSDQFIFTDHRTDVDRFISAMDICVLSTHREGMPLVILEAMAHSKPIVATSVGGIPEAVRHGETGLLVPHGDAEALASELARLLDDRELASRLGEGGGRLVEGEFSLANFASRGRALYRSLLGPPG